MSHTTNLGPNPGQLTRREGFRLISTRRVALPVWRVDLQCRVLQTRRISATDEFTLRAIDLGIGDALELSEFLNLPQDLVDGVLANLLAERHVRVDRRGDRSTLALSDSGKKTVETLVDKKPVEKTNQYFVDGLSGEPIAVKKTSLLSAVQLDETPHLILEPEEDPDLEFGPQDTDRFIAVGSRSSTREQDVLLSVIASEATVKRYRPAAGLLFQSTSDSDDFYLRVCVDGRIREDLESSIREQGVLGSLGLVTRIAEDRNRIDRALGQELTELRTDDSVAESLRDEIARLGGPATTELSGATGTAFAASSVSNRASARLAGLEVRRLQCVDATEALQFSLSSGRAEILISTARFWHEEQHEHNVDLIRQLLASGIVVNLEVPADERQISLVDRECLAKLEKELVKDGLALWKSKASHEANFVSIDGEIAYVFAGSPFVDVATSAERFGDDRPTVVAGPERVQGFLDRVHRGSSA